MFRQISRNNITQFGDLTRLTYVFIDLDFIQKTLTQVNNHIAFRKNYDFLNSTYFLIKEDEMNYMIFDCEMLIEFMKRNINLNLDSDEKLSRFYSKCHLIDLNF